MDSESRSRLATGSRGAGTLSWRRAVRCLCWRLLLLVTVIPGALAGDQRVDSLPRIALIIDDMGYRVWQGRAALSLPGPVTYSFLPHTPHARRLAETAHRLGKEVMLHLPMEPETENWLGPGGLTSAMSEEQLKQTLHLALASVPHVVGVNNHMGSLLTRQEDRMQWLMQGILDNGELYFIDSRTSSETIAEAMALRMGIPAARRNVFLDNNKEPGAIREQFRELLRIAETTGQAIGIGHPYAETLEVLEEQLERLADRGVRLVPASELATTDIRSESWHAYSSPLPRVVKSSRP